MKMMISKCPVPLLLALSFLFVSAVLLLLLLLLLLLRWWVARYSSPSAGADFVISGEGRPAAVAATAVCGG